MKNSVIKNIGWIVGCKIGQSIISLIIGVITARYLGPSNYGIISYAASVVAFFIPIMQLGLNNTLVKELVSSPEKEGRILGTSLILNIISSLFCIIGSATFVLVVNAGETETILVCILYSFTLLFNATEITQYWFQAKLLSKHSSICTLVAYVIVAIYKLYLLITQKSIAWFAMSNVIDYLLISILLLITYKKEKGPQLIIDWKLGRKMLSESKHYIIPGMMVVIFQHTDQIMIKLMIDETEAGYYSAAITCIGICGFVFAAIIDSMRPVIVEAKNCDKNLYENRMVQLYSIIIYLSLAQSLSMTLLAKPIVLLLYGDEYFKASTILATAVWYIMFGHCGSVRNIWILAEGKQKYLMGINLAGASANVLLNYFFITSFGAVGAAIASVITQFFTNVVIGFVFKPLRPNNKLMLRGLNPLVLKTALQQVIHSRKKVIKK